MGLLLSLIMLAQAGALAAAAPVAITDHSSNQGRPDVQGSIIVWKDLRAGNWDIYSHNLLTGIEAPEETNPAYQNVPATNGTIITWQDNRSGANDIYIRNLATGITELLVSGPGNQGLPAIDGGIIAYVDDALGNNNIFAIDINTRAVTMISINPANQWQPRISGNIVVWEDQRGGDWDIYMRDLGESGDQLVAGGAGDQRVADIDGDIVVWQDYTGGRYNIMMKDLATGVTTAVTDDSDYQTSPRVSKDLITWENYSYADKNYDVLVRDLTSGETIVAAAGPQIQARPAIDGEIVVWEEEGPHGYDIWLNRIPDVTPPAISDTLPAEDQPCGCVAPLVTASLSDNRTGVDSYSVTLKLDGADVTGAAVITSSSVTYQAPALADGEHTVSLQARDIAGNVATREWEFTTEAIALKLDYLNAFWADYTDYSNRLLSVRYRLKNSTAASGATAAEITAAPSTSGVVPAGPLPQPLGALEAGAYTDATVKYLVPMSVSTFKSRLFIRVVDSCGASIHLPGPPPAS
ncbi:MAG: Ig-like domain-containing protein [Thermoleophilia bacterium]